MACLMHLLEAITKSNKFATDQLINAFPYFDKYTTKNGAFGYYGGSTMSRATQSLLRQIGLGSARLPELIRAEKKGVSIPEKLTPGGGRFPWVNFTTEHVVRDHRKGKWKGSDVVITDPSMIDPKHYLSVDPSDTFIANGLFADNNPAGHTLISGNVDLLNRAKESGMETLSSPRLRKIFKKMNSAENMEERGRIGIFDMSKKGTEYNPYSSAYTHEINRLLRKRGAPLYKDYKLQSDLTGLPIQVFKHLQDGDKFVRAHNPFYYLKSSPVESKFRKFIGMGIYGLEPWSKYTRKQLEDPEFLRHLLNEHNL